MLQNLSSAAVVIGALRVKAKLSMTEYGNSIPIPFQALNVLPIKMSYFFFLNEPVH